MRLPPFQALIDVHGRDVHRFLIARVGAGDAEDCWQETWLAALRAYPSLAETSNLRGWLFTIAHHKVIDHVRSRSRRAEPVGDLAEVTRDRDDGGAGGGVAGGGDVWAAVARLPDKQRTALALRFIADCTHAEIATVMQTSQPAARRNVHEAMKRLREEYQP